MVEIWNAHTFSDLNKPVILYRLPDLDLDARDTFDV